MTDYNSYTSFYTLLRRPVQDQTTPRRSSSELTGVNRNAITPSQDVLEIRHNVEETNSRIKRAENIISQSFGRFKEAGDEVMHNPEKRSMLFNTVSPIAPFRRISSAPTEMENDNPVRAAGLLGLAAICFPEDLRDLRSAIQQINNKILPNSVKSYLEKNHNKFFNNFIKYKPTYDYKQYQHSFSFCKGSLLEPLQKRFKRAGKLMTKHDTTLYDAKFGKFLQKHLNIKEETISIKTDKTKILASQIKGNAAQRLIGRAMLRIPVISVIALAALELPTIINAACNGEKIKEKINNGLKQVLKSGAYLTSIFTGIGLGGALLSKKGPAGSLLGMGIGAVAGSFVSKKVSQKIDEM